MSETSWLIAALVLVAAAAVLIRPGGARLNRLHGSRKSTVDAGARWDRISVLAEVSPWRLVLMVGLIAAGAGLVLGGPVAAVVLVAYSALGVRALHRRTRTRGAAQERAVVLDDLCGLAADLRAGLPPAPRPVRASSSGDTARIAELTGAVWRLAERTGAPAADLVERIEADARTADRAQASAAAEAAGAQVTAILLAALPVGGIALGYSIGADPLAVLLHTPIGAACAVAAVLLQFAGILWSDRLMAGTQR